MFFKTICIIFCLMKIKGNSGYNDSNAEANAKYLQQTSIIYALSTFAQNAPINAECSTQLQQFQQQSLNKTAWAMKMLDASGRNLPGFLFDQNYWLGDREICAAVQAPLELLLTERHKRNMHWGILNETAPYDVSFYVVYLRHKSRWQVEMKYLPIEGILHIGLCAPAACKVHDLKPLMEQFLKHNLNGANDFYELNAKLFYIKQPNWSWLLNMKLFQSLAFVFLACLTSATFLLMLCAAIFAHKQNEKVGKFFGFVKCFDLVANARKIFVNCSGKNGADDIAVIEGLRVVVSFAIVSVHVAYYTFPVVGNQPIVMTIIGNKSMLVIHVAVDFFFAISGFLQAYKFLNNPQQLQSLRKASVLNVFRAYFGKLFHRWLRLAPLFYVIICLQVLIVIYLNENSVYHIFMRDDKRFPRDWWFYLLFIQNIIGGMNTIANWTWSMGCDLQFFIVGTLLLLIYAKKPLMAKFGFLFLLLVNLGFYYYNGIIQRFGFNHDDFMPNAKAMYVNPLVRCTSYLIGIFCAWYITTPKKRFREFTERLIGNLVFIIFLMLLILVSFCDIPNGIVAITLLVVSRISISLWICWLIIAEVTNRKTWLSTFLKLNCFRPFARMSFAFYLIHPCIVIFVAYTTNAGLHLDTEIMVILYFGFVFAGYAFALIGALIYEVPFCNLSSFLIKNNKIST